MSDNNKSNKTLTSDDQLRSSPVFILKSSLRSDIVHIGTWVFLEPKSGCPFEKLLIVGVSVLGQILTRNVEDARAVAFIVLHLTLDCVISCKISQFFIPYLLRWGHFVKIINYRPIILIIQNKTWTLLFTMVAIRLAGSNPGVCPNASWFRSLLWASRMICCNSSVISISSPSWHRSYQS